MRRREDHAIAKHTLNLYAGDYEELQRLYGTRIGAAKVIRSLVRDHLKEIRHKAAERQAQQARTNIYER
jgi:hypothetical protein